MTRHVPISEFKDHASELIAAAESGEDIVITRHGRPTVKLVATEAGDCERKARIALAMANMAALQAQMRSQGRVIAMNEMVAWKSEGRR
ncbi:MAG: Antitoxin Phd YefM, type toxin-antitoxin system [Pseudomonadota bacterium]|jgi:prevent-host-death family protein